MSKCICMNCFTYLFFIGELTSGYVRDTRDDTNAIDMLLQRLTNQPISLDSKIANAILRIVHSDQHSSISCIFYTNDDDLWDNITDEFEARNPGLDFRNPEDTSTLIRFLEFFIEYKRDEFFNNDLWIYCPLDDNTQYLDFINKFQTFADKWETLSIIIPEDILRNVFRNMVINLIYRYCNGVVQQNPEIRMRLIGRHIRRVLDIAEDGMPGILNGLNDVAEISDCLKNCRIAISYYLN